MASKISKWFKMHQKIVAHRQLYHRVLEKIKELFLENM
ncbi:Uncharacterised protein (plasmid) [Legionella adelaidensis]|uniref:Uncharacterized protein n=1 Tax=Legionella adelaidensis TaxID=45056 RepID=A0A3S4V2J8_9GAMM|nr:Uncharacterised protein [Legionella adelaidensis]